MNARAKPAIDTATGVAHVGGDASIYARVLRRFAESFAGTPEAILAALAHDQTEHAVRLAHTLKGAAGTIGAETLQDAAWRLEQSLRSGTDDGGGPLGDMAAELLRVLREIDGLG